MIESIHIRNLGPIKDIRLDNIKPFTILIGDSGSGKSTLLKALALCRWLFKMCNIREYLHQSGIRQSPFRFRADALLANCGFSDFITDETEISYGVTYNQALSDDVAPPADVQLHIKKKKLDLKEVSIPREHLAFNKVSFVGEARGIIPSFLSASGSSSRRASLGFYFDEVLNDFLRATPTVQKLDIPFLGVQFVVEKVMYQDKYFLRPSEQSPGTPYKIELRHGSSGMQNTVPLLTILKHFSQNFDFENAFKRSVLEFLYSADRLTDFKPAANLGSLSKRIYVHIEEPELGLFPAAQCALVNELVRQCVIEKTNPLSMIMATHSPFVLAHVNNMLQAGQIKEFEANANLQVPPLAKSSAAVYQVADGTCLSLLDDKTGLIGNNVIDTCTSNLYSKFDTLLEMERHE